MRAQNFWPDPILLGLLDIGLAANDLEGEQANQYGAEDDGGQDEEDSVLAAQAVEFAGTPLESIVISFQEGDATGDEQRTREFIFLVMEDRPVLQPYIDPDATGPLTSAELRAAVDRLGESPPGEGRECILREAEQRARLLGDPDTLDPAKVEFLSAETLSALDILGAEKRLFLAQAITTEALFTCVGR